MASTPVEIIATVFVLAFIVKILILLTNRDSWLKTTEKLYDRPYLSRILFGLLGILILIFLLEELSITQILAVMAFTTIMVAYELMEYPTEAKKIAKKAMKGKISNSQLVYVAFWCVIMAMAFHQIFLQ